ncbi:MAG: ATPase [Pseudomonadota bacterium]
METIYDIETREAAEEATPLVLRSPVVSASDALEQTPLVLRDPIPATPDAMEEITPLVVRDPVPSAPYDVEEPEPLVLRDPVPSAPYDVEEPEPLVLRDPVQSTSETVEEPAPMVLRNPAQSKVDKQPASGVPMPQAPGYIDETGLDEGFLLDLLVKTMYRQNQETATALAEALCLVRPIIEELILLGREAKLIESMGQLGASFSAEMRYALTEKGKGWAAEALAQSEWVGPCPITLEKFHAQTKSQSIRERVLSEQMLAEVFNELTLAPDLMDQLGPAVNSGASILLYGPPGNGKSSISSAICEAFRDHVYLPHAVLVDKQIIALFDTAVHTPVDDDAPQGQDGIRRGEGGFDRRFVRCERPQVETGGELTLEMLDLRYNPVSRVYEAPMQMKAASGVLVVDDFGRQRQSPQELINRLIVPLEKGIDYLSLMTGRKFEVPFDALTIFSTNIPPKELVDDAALRRLRYKILVDQPDQQTYLQIFANTAWAFEMELTEEILGFILFELYEQTPGAELHAFHPRFLIEQTRAICTYKGVAPELRPEFLEKAWRNLFTQE